MQNVIKMLREQTGNKNMVGNAALAGRTSEAMDVVRRTL